MADGPPDDGLPLPPLLAEAVAAAEAEADAECSGVVVSDVEIEDDAVADALATEAMTVATIMDHELAIQEATVAQSCHLAASHVSRQLSTAAAHLLIVAPPPPRTPDPTNQLSPVPISYHTVWPCGRAHSSLLVCTCATLLHVLPLACCARRLLKAAQPCACPCHHPRQWRRRPRRPRLPDRFHPNHKQAQEGGQASRARS